MITCGPAEDVWKISGLAAYSTDFLKLYMLMIYPLILRTFASESGYWYSSVPTGNLVFSITGATMTADNHHQNLKVLP